MNELHTLSTPIPGVLSLKSQPHADERGGFLRAYCETEFAALGLPAHFPQHNFSTNVKRGTLRGLHASAGEEYKLVRCVHGRIWDVAVDLRPESPAYRRWWAAELGAGDALFIPAGCAHGFLALEDNSHLYYLMGSAYQPSQARGIRWDDPALAIGWPFPPAIISAQDKSWPLLAL